MIGMTFALNYLKNINDKEDGMNRYLKVMAVLIVMFAIGGEASAITYNFNDNVIYWPGYSLTAHNTIDQIGQPTVRSMDVTINDVTNNLEQVVIHEQFRDQAINDVVGGFDTLFIHGPGWWISKLELLC